MQSELRHLSQQFALLDTDNSGTISIEEMMQALASFRTGEDGGPVYNSEEIRAVRSRATSTLPLPPASGRSCAAPAASAPVSSCDLEPAS